jgi:hypothetical protein
MKHNQYTSSSKINGMYTHSTGASSLAYLPSDQDYYTCMPRDHINKASYSSLDFRGLASQSSASQTLIGTGQIHDRQYERYTDRVY